MYRDMNGGLQSPIDKAGPPPDILTISNSKGALMRIALVLSLFLFAAPALAQDSAPDPGEEMERAAREAVENIMRALDLFVQSIPQYEAPEVMPNGDIVIRRKPKPGDPPRRDPYEYPYEGPCEIDSEIVI